MSVPGGDPAWFSALRQASFRSIPFGVLTGESHFGRRTALHEYPFRDTPWVEDLGRGTRRYNIQGFLVSNSLVYGAGDVLSQRDDIKAAIEAPGSGTLVHPTLGNLTVIGTVAILERWDAGRYFELQLSFVDAGAPQYPTNVASTGTTVSEVAVPTANAGVQFDFSNTATPLLAGGDQVIGAGVSSTEDWTEAIVGLGAGSTSLINLASQMVGPYGRYFNAGNAGLSGPPGSVYAADVTVDDLAAQATAQRAQLAAAAAAEVTTAQNLGLPAATPADLATAAQATIAALQTTAANPGDAINLMAEVQAAIPPGAPGIAGAIGDLHRRVAVTAMATSSAAYQPTSYNDAAQMRTLVTSAIDAEIAIAGDQSDDTSFQTLRALRTAVVQDLTARGASLAQMALVETPSPLPALVLAERLYRDASRADQLVTEANPIHPLFMPTSFMAPAA